MFVVTVLFEAFPEHAARFLTRVRMQASDSLDREEGCHRFDVCTDPGVPERVLLYELYTDRAAFDTHLASPHFRAFDAESADWVRLKTVNFWDLAPSGA